MSTADKYYRSALDYDGYYNNRQKRLDWNSTFNSIENVMCALRELIDIRDGYKNVIPH